MAETELDKIKKLPPKERLAKLRELEDKRKVDLKKRTEETKKQEADAKKEEAEARKIIDESLKELKLDEMLKEIDVPKDDGVDVKRLLEQSAVEEEAKLGKIKIDHQEDYGKRIDALLPKNTVNEIQGWYKHDAPAPDKEEFLEVYGRAREAYETIREQMQARPAQDQYAASSQKLAEDVVASMKMLRSMGYQMNFFHP